MKKILIPALCLLLALLCACGKTPAPATEDTSDASDVSAAADESTTAAAQEPVTFDNTFDFLKGDLPKGWTRNDALSTSTYLEATYGEGENAPRFTVSVMNYDDEMGADKAKLLADKVHEREAESASEIGNSKIGGLDFYSMSYNSLVTKDTRCYVFYGQTVPDKNKAYKFVEIQIDNIKDDKQYESLKGVLDMLEFKF